MTSPQRVIGLIGGLSWESSAEYYRVINQTVHARLGGVHSARVLMWSFDFGEIEALQHAGRWNEAAALLVDAARRLERGGADFVLLCTNTMHRMAEEVRAAIGVPLLHIADPTAERIRAAGLRRVGLLGTRFTMEQAFYTGRLADRHGLDVLVPGDADRAVVHRVIYDELVQGRVEPASREAYRGVIARLVQAVVAEGFVNRLGFGIVTFALPLYALELGMSITEIGLLIGPEDCPVPVFDTTTLHAEAAVEWALSPHPSRCAVQAVPRPFTMEHTP